MEAKRRGRFKGVDAELMVAWGVKKRIGVPN
jgi:hypothetical protein